jgi:hypothetical protein
VNKGNYYNEKKPAEVQKPAPAEPEKCSAIEPGDRSRAELSPCGRGSKDTPAPFLAHILGSSMVRRLVFPCIPGAIVLTASMSLPAPASDRAIAETAPAAGDVKTRAPALDEAGAIGTFKGRRVHDGEGRVIMVDIEAGNGVIHVIDNRYASGRREDGAEEQGAVVTTPLEEPCRNDPFTGRVVPFLERTSS